MANLLVDLEASSGNYAGDRAKPIHQVRPATESDGESKSDVHFPGYSPHHYFGIIRERPGGFRITPASP
ncbi:hypothetical protein GCM10028792_18620 [Salinisphaera aquimarina]